MKFLNVLLLAFAGTAIAKGKNSTSTSSQCRQMARLESFQKLASNDTLLAQRTKNNATKIAEIKKKAETEKPKLAALQANATLTGICAQRASVKSTERQCGQMVRMQRLEKLVANDTALNQFTKNNATRADAIKKKVQDDKARLTTMAANATLTSFCAAFETKQTCGRMQRLAKKVDAEQKMLKNQTALDTRFGKNQTRIDAFKAKAAKEQDRLKAMQSNSTLASACKISSKAPSAPNAQNPAAPSSSAPAGNKPASAAPAVQAMGVSASLLALAVAGLLSL